MSLPNADSEAMFEDKCSELGLASLLPQMKARGWGTFGNFSFCVPWSHERRDELFIERVVNVLVCENDPREPALTRLHFEAFTRTTAELKGDVEATDETAPRRMGAPERERRKQVVLSKMPSRKMLAYQEPGDGLINTAAQMFLDKCLVYLHPECCPSRNQEMEHRQPGKPWIPPTGKQLVINIASLLNIERAYKRRGVAFEMGGLMSMETHNEVLVETLMAAMTDEPPDSRFAPASLEQVISADKWIFQRLNDLCRTGFRASEGILASGCGSQASRK